MRKLFYILILLTGVANAQIVNIPDTNFKNRLITLGIDTNIDGEIQQIEADAVTEELNLDSSNIQDMTGIGSFTNMQYLRCSSNSFATLTINNMPNLKVLECNYSSILDQVDLSNLPALDSLKCNNNFYHTLNINGLNNLKHLDASNSSLSSINFATIPNLKSLNISNNGFTTLNLTLLPNLDYLNCSGNSLTTLNFTSTLLLKHINFSNNTIQNVSIINLPQLEYLNCGNNQMTNLNINNLPLLNYLVCSGNFLTILDATSFTNLQTLISDGNYFTLLNVNGLTNLTYISCALTQLPALNVSTLSNLSYLNCSGNQMTSLNVSGLANLQQLYCLGNQLTSLNLTGATAINILNIENNLLTSVDLTGLVNLNDLQTGSNPFAAGIDVTMLPLLTNLVCRNNQLTSLDVSQNTNLIYLSCENNQLTTLDCSNNPNLYLLIFYANELVTLFIKNGSNEGIEINNWVENPTLQYVCADESQLGQILTAVGTGVVVNSYCSFTPGGDYNTINGTMLFDADNNGCDAADSPQSFIKAKIDYGNIVGTSFTNADGNYGFFTQAGNFTITPTVEDPTWFTFSPANAIINFADNNNNMSTNDFCIAANGVHPDVEVVIAPITPARPGFDAKYQIVYKNKGNQTLSGNITFTYNDSVLDFLSATVVPDTQSSGLLNWNYTNLLPFENKSIYFDLNVNAPTETPAVNIGDVLDFEATITPVIGDEIPVDNLFTYNQTVVGSYDPNDITCLEGAIVPPTEIGEYLHYVINFENTGTAPAENVVVKTTIDATKFDVNTVQIMNSSNNAYIKQTGNVVEFVFENLNLDSGGHGNVLLKIKTNNTLVQGDIVAKRADIFFDYNFPIDTGFANTTFQALSNPDFETDNSISVYPNPTTSTVNINGDFNIKTVQLYDVQGRLLQTIVNDGNSVVLDVSSHQAGIYFIKATSDKGIKVEKIVKE